MPLSPKGDSPLRTNLWHLCGYHLQGRGPLRAECAADEPFDQVLFYLLGIFRCLCGAGQRDHWDHHFGDRRRFRHAPRAVTPDPADAGFANGLLHPPRERATSAFLRISSPPPFTEPSSPPAIAAGRTRTGTSAYFRRHSKKARNTSSLRRHISWCTRTSPIGWRTSGVRYPPRQVSMTTNAT